MLYALCFMLYDFCQELPIVLKYPYNIHDAGGGEAQLKANMTTKAKLFAVRT